MKKVYWILAVLFPSITYAQLQIGAGTTWRSDASTYVVLNNIGLQYNTNTQVIDNIFKFTGNTDVAISCTNLPVLSQIQIAKTGIAKIILQNDININQSVAFQSGLFDLGNSSLTLGTAASISGENETTRFMSSGAGEIVMYPTITNAPLGVNPG